MPLHTPAPATSVRPLLKWAGGKRQLLNALRDYVPQQFTGYVEPFFGSGALFFHLLGGGALHGKRVRLADVNADLIGCYRTVRDRTDAVIDALADLEADHRRRGDAAYYEVRDLRFNPARTAIRDAFPPGALADRYTPALAAMLIFLNRTGFNGLFRLNRRGGFNVPAGRYAEPRICDPAHVRAVAHAFAAPGVTIDWAPFDVTMAGAGAGDFIYCDPPYAPLSPTASFASYTADGFSQDDQARLQRAVISASACGARVVLSNSSAVEILGLYGSAAAVKAGLTVRTVPARRAINSRGAARGPVDELIVSNGPAPLAGVRMQMLPARRSVAKRKSA